MSRVPSKLDLRKIDEGKHAADIDLSEKWFELLSSGSKQLKERVLVEKLLPKRYQRAIETATFRIKRPPWTH